jgi:hypothetical protein
VRVEFNVVECSERERDCVHLIAKRRVFMPANSLAREERLFTDEPLTELICSVVDDGEAVWKRACG